VDERLLRVHLRGAAAEREEGNVDPFERSPYRVAVSEVGADDLHRQRPALAVDEHTARLLWVAGERARRLACSAKRGGDAAGDAPPASGDQDARHEQDGEGIDGGSGLIWCMRWLLGDVVLTSGPLAFPQLDLLDLARRVARKFPERDAL